MSLLLTVTRNSSLTLNSEIFMRCRISCGGASNYGTAIAWVNIGLKKYSDWKNENNMSLSGDYEPVTN